MPPVRRPLGDVAIVRSGANLPARAPRGRGEREETFRLLRPADLPMELAWVRKTAGEACLLPDVTSVRNALVEPGDLLLAIRGEPRVALVGPLGLDRALATSNLAVVSPEPGVLLPGYLAGWLAGAEGRAQLRRLSSGQAAFGVIRLEALRRLEVPVPALKDQESVAVAVRGLCVHRRKSERVEEAHRRVVQAELDLSTRAGGGPILSQASTLVPEAVNRVEAGELRAVVRAVEALADDLRRAGLTDEEIATLIATAWAIVVVGEAVEVRVPEGARQRWKDLLDLMADPRWGAALAPGSVFGTLGPLLNSAALPICPELWALVARLADLGRPRPEGHLPWTNLGAQAPSDLLVQVAYPGLGAPLVALDREAARVGAPCRIHSQEPDESLFLLARLFLRILGLSQLVANLGHQDPLLNTPQLSPMRRLTPRQERPDRAFEDIDRYVAWNAAGRPLSEEERAALQGKWTDWAIDLPCDFAQRDRDVVMTAVADAALAPSGRAVLVVHANLLHRGGAAARLRDHLTARNRVEGVVHLPLGTVPGIQVPLCLLILQEGRPASAPVWVARIPARDAPRGTSTLAPELAEQVAEALLGGRVVPGLVEEVSVSALSQDTWDHLSPQALPTADAVDREAALAELLDAKEALAADVDPDAAEG